MPAGRPSEYTPETAEVICSQLAHGMSLREICRADGMPDKTTVLRWLSSFPEFRTQYEISRQLQAEHMADEILEIADDGSNDWMERQNSDGTTYEVMNSEHVQRSRLRIDSRKWLLSKMLPKKYGDKLDLSAELTGKNGTPLIDLPTAVVDLAQAYAKALKGT